MPPEYYLCTFIGSISSFDVELNQWLLDVAKLLLQLGLINQAQQNQIVWLIVIKNALFFFMVSRLTFCLSYKFLNFLFLIQ